MPITLFGKNKISKQEEIHETQQLLRLNRETQNSGLELSEKDAVSLVRTRQEALAASGRVEFGDPALKKIIRTFSRSKYLYQSNYASVLHELLEEFFLLKNETHDRISDQELIDFLFDTFEHRYRGSLEMFRSRELEEQIKNLFGADDECEEEPEEEEDEE